jgi:competence protein ComEA
VVLPDDRPPVPVGPVPVGVRSRVAAAPVPGPPRTGRRSAGWVPDRASGSRPSLDAAVGSDRDARAVDLRERVTDRLPQGWRHARVGLPVPAAVVALLLLTVASGVALAVLLLGRPGEVTQVVPARAVAPVAGPVTGPAAAAPAGNQAGAPGPQQPGTAAPPPAADPAPTPSPPLVVHVIGAVGEPGVVDVPAGARVADAVEAAGGLTAEADLTRVNLARALVDGEQVHVPRPGEELAGDLATATQGADAGGAAAAAPAEAIDLNSADPAALEELPGIGPVLAERIVQWREAHGRFTAVDELGEVSGIGTALLERLRPLVRV